MAALPALPLPVGPPPADYEFDSVVDREADISLSEANLGDATRCCAPSLLRGAVSRKKKRFVDDTTDLDLSYITNKIIAMGYPSQGLESVYRNPSDAVVTFLERRHRFHYRIWNLCSEKEREYERGAFNCEIERFAWADHTPPPFAMMLPACESMDSWLSADDSNVVVVHCKAGKGRTGCLIAAYLVHARAVIGADAAIEFFGVRRTRNGKGVTIPSQHRYIRYYAMQTAALRLAARNLVCNAPGMPPSRISTAHLDEAGATPTTPGSAPADAPQAVPVAAGSGLPPAPAPASTAPASIATSGALGVIVRADEEPEALVHPSASKPGKAPDRSRPLGATSLVLTVEVTRDSDRTPGFSVEHNAASRPCIGGVRTYGNKAGSGGGSGSNSRMESSSILPVPISSILRAGDELLAVNGIEVAHRSFSEVISILRGATDPLRIRVARKSAPAAPIAPVVSALGESPLLVSPPPLVLPRDYAHRIARGIGPWSASADPRVVPMPRIHVLGFALSHVPDVRSRHGFCCPAPPNQAGWYLQIFGGPSCRTLIFDSREISVSYTLSDAATAEPAAVVAAGKGLEMTASVSKRSLASRSAAEMSPPAPPASLSWKDTVFLGSTADGVPPVSCAGDFRLVLCKAGLSKPVASSFLNTAFLPLPHEVRPAVIAAMQDIPSPTLRAGVSLPGSSLAGVPAPTQQELAVAQQSADDATAASSVDALSPTPSDRSRLALSATGTGTGTGTGISPSPPVGGDDVSPVAQARPSTPIQPSGGARDAAVAFTGLEALPSEPPRVKSLTAPRPPPVACLSNIICSGDVSGAPIGIGLPLLGSLYTATGRDLHIHAPSLSAPKTAPTSSMHGTGYLVLPKAAIDGACRDKHHEVFPRDFTITLHYRAADLPPEYVTLMHGEAASTPTPHSKTAVAEPTAAVAFRV